MNKEKQIEEMAKIFCGMKNGCDGCMWDKVHCYERNDAKDLYNAGYRKASEVAREIFEEIGELVNEYLDGRIYTHDFCTYLAELKKKHTESEKDK
jgi:hypothetical protein